MLMKKETFKIQTGLNLEGSYLIVSFYVQAKTGQLVLADSNKVIGHRAYKVYYNQKQHSDVHLQLMTSLLQEHKRLAMIQHQKAYVLHLVTGNLHMTE